MIELNEQLFWEKVDKDGANGCWVWTGASDGKYGVVRLRKPRRNMTAHRVSFYFATGRLSQNRNVVVHHMCNNGLCVNPDHLEMIKQSTNVALSFMPQSLRVEAVDLAERMPQGWQCPVCYRVNAPYKTTCVCSDT